MSKEIRIPEFFDVNGEMHISYKLPSQEGVRKAPKQSMDEYLKRVDPVIDGANPRTEQSFFRQKQKIDLPRRPQAGARTVRVERINDVGSMGSEEFEHFVDQIAKKS